MSKKKHQKTLGKSCPECDGTLELVSESYIRDGVQYTDQYEECDCGYKKKFKTNKRFREDDSLW